MTPPALTAIDLMQPTQVARPFHCAATWVYEVEYDGWRMLAYKEDGPVRLVSRPGRDHTRGFPALVAAIAALVPSTLILDGEVCMIFRITAGSCSVAISRSCLPHSEQARTSMANPSTSSTAAGPPPHPTLAQPRLSSPADIARWSDHHLRHPSATD